MNPKLLQLNPRDNVLVALQNLVQGHALTFSGQSYSLGSNVAAKHKFAIRDLSVGDPILMYGVVVGKAVEPIAKGNALTTRNVRHDASDFHEKSEDYRWTPPNASRWATKAFRGYRRSDGQVGTRNYWLVVPLVFCENRNIGVLKQAFEEELGFAAPQVYRRQVKSSPAYIRKGSRPKSIRLPFLAHPPRRHVQRFSKMSMASSSSCTKAAVAARARIRTIFAASSRAISTIPMSPAQPSSASVASTRKFSSFARNCASAIPTSTSLSSSSNSSRPALKRPTPTKPSAKPSWVSLKQTELAHRRAPLPSLRRTQMRRLGRLLRPFREPGDRPHRRSARRARRRALLSEFPELCGVEQELINRCTSREIGDRFIHLMRSYNSRAKAVGSGFEMNPSPGNIRDGLLTDAMKSAGAAKKGGTSPVTGVLYYPEYSSGSGLKSSTHSRQ